MRNRRRMSGGPARSDMASPRRKTHPSVEDIATDAHSTSDAIACTCGPADSISLDLENTPASASPARFEGGDLRQKAEPEGGGEASYAFR